MAFQSSYRKYRPAFFKDVVGQHHIITILKNQVLSQNFSHAYLFCGTRGTGKTTIAKIFSRAINCLSPVDGDPCDKCDICVANKNNPVDIIEMDAASNNGVDEIRDLRDKVRFAPLESKYKVYIIDEVHMLSTGAFNALLKTLEEPPEHAIFILATTEQQKIPATILSRCQRYEFSRISVELIVSHLEKITADLDVIIDPNGLLAIAYAAQGAMRDALSLCDQCVAYSSEKIIPYESVLDILGSMNNEFMFEISDAIIDGDIQKTFSCVDTIINSGRDINVFAQDLILHFRSLMLLNPKNPVIDGVVFHKKEVELFSTQKKRTCASRCVQTIELISHATQNMRSLIYPRIALETALIKACLPLSESQDFDQLAKKIESLENKITFLETQLQNSAVFSNQSSAKPNQKNNTDKVFEKSFSPLIPKNISEIDTQESKDSKHNTLEIYNYLIENLTPALSTMLSVSNWQCAFNKNFIELIAPKDCAPGIFNAMKDKTPLFAEIVAKKYPSFDFRVVKSDNFSETESTLKQQAIDVFGEDNIS